METLSQDSKERLIIVADRLDVKGLSKEADSIFSILKEGRIISLGPKTLEEQIAEIFGPLNNAANMESRLRKGSGTGSIETSNEGIINALREVIELSDNAIQNLRVKKIKEASKKVLAGTVYDGPVFAAEKVSSPRKEIQSKSLLDLYVLSKFHKGGKWDSARALVTDPESGITIRTILEEFWVPHTRNDNLVIIGPEMIPQNAIAVPSNTRILNIEGNKAELEHRNYIRLPSTSGFILVPLSKDWKASESFEELREFEKSPEAGWGERPLSENELRVMLKEAETKKMEVLIKIEENNTQLEELKSREAELIKEVTYPVPGHEIAESEKELEEVKEKIVMNSSIKKELEEKLKESEIEKEKISKRLKEVMGLRAEGAIYTYQGKQIISLEGKFFVGRKSVTKFLEGKNYSQEKIDELLSSLPQKEISQDTFMDLVEKIKSER